MKKISVIVPIYNTEKYLSRCIESIQNQTYSCLEIILVNDGSKDNSLNICYHYAQNDNRIKVVNKENTGVSDTRNTGIKNSTGDYISFVDSDDYLESKMYEILIKNIDDQTMPICAYNMVGENSYIVGEKIFSTIPSTILTEDFFVLCENIMLNSPFNKLFNANYIKNNSILFDTTLSLGEDFLFVLEYMQFIKKFSIINVKLYNYMVIERPSLSQIYRKDFYNIQRKIICKIKSILDTDFYMKQKYKRRFYTFALDLYLQSLNNTFSNKNDESIKQKIYKNNKIMQDCIFNECLLNAELSNLNKLYIKLLKFKRYELILIYKEVIDILRKGRGYKK